MHQEADQTTMNRTVLLIEDSEQLRHMFSLVLRVDGYTVLEAATGSEGLALLQQNTPDHILLDMLLPNISGEELLRYIYSAPHLQHSQLIVVTAHESFQSIPLREGDVFLLKPVTGRELREVIQSSITPTS
jgi:CheY-like chemotaxis protein